MSLGLLTATGFLLPVISFAADTVTSVPVEQAQLNDMITYFAGLVHNGEWMKLIGYGIGTAIFCIFSFTKIHVPGIVKSIADSLNKKATDSKDLETSSPAGLAAPVAPAAPKAKK